MWKTRISNWKFRYRMWREGRVFTKGILGGYWQKKDEKPWVPGQSFADLPDFDPRRRFFLDPMKAKEDPEGAKKAGIAHEHASLVSKE
jgi:hypothetical protein